jgi:hypothetical protein
MTTTWTTSPAALLGLGGSAMRPCTDLDLRTVIGVSPAPLVAQVRGTGVPAGSAARLRPVFLQAVGSQAVNEAQTGAGFAAFTHNSIGTTLGIHPSRRPQS